MLCYLSCGDGVSCNAHPICVEVDIFLGFCWGMGHYHKCTWLLLCSWWPPATPCPVKWSIWGVLHVLWSNYGGLWGWGPKMFLEPVPKWSAWFSYILLWAVGVWALNLYITPLFWSLLSLSLGTIRRVLMVLLPLKCTWIAKLLQVLLNFPKSFCVGYHYGKFFIVWSINIYFCLCHCKYCMKKHTTKIL